MSEIRFVARNGEAVRQALERGEVLHLDTASEEITDEFRLALLLTAFRRLALSRAAVPPDRGKRVKLIVDRAVSRAAVPPEVWKVFDFPRRSFALCFGLRPPLDGFRALSRQPSGCAARGVESLRLSTTLLRACFGLRPPLAVG
jgi:hypothetical protein